MPVKNVKRPDLATPRHESQLQWLDVGEFLEDYSGWQFAIAPQASLTKLEKIVLPLSQLEDITTSKPRANSSKKSITNLANNLTECITELCAGLAVVIRDWNFVDESTGDELDPPRGNPEVLKELDFRLIAAMAGLVSSYLMGADPKNLERSEEEDEEQ